MSVCMSAVLAGISEVLIKYTGNVWLHTNFHFDSCLFFNSNFFPIQISQEISINFDFRFESDPISHP